MGNLEVTEPSQLGNAQRLTFGTTLTTLSILLTSIRSRLYIASNWISVESG